MRVVTQVALTGIRVLTQDFGRKSKLKFLGRNPSCSYVKPVVTRGSTVYMYVKECLRERVTDWIVGYVTTLLTG
jgi:hypothetical protein